MIREELDAAYDEVMSTGQFILGEQVDRFETEWAAFCGSPACVGVASGTDALILALQACGVGPGTKVAAPAFTFIATASAAMHLGAEVWLVDVDPATLTIDPASLSTVLFDLDGRPVPGFMAVVATDLYGLPYDYDPVYDVVRTYERAVDDRLYLIEDAAQAAGSRYRDKMAGTLGDLTAWSFFPTKPLGALGDGGAVTGDAALVAGTRLLRNHGSRRKYEHEVLGRNSRLDELQAAWLRVKLKHLPQYLVGRQRIATDYLNGLGDLDIGLPTTFEDRRGNWAQFTIQIPTDRDETRRRMLEMGVEASVHYPKGLQDQPAMVNARGRGLDVAKVSGQHVLCLPCYPEMSTAEAAAVIVALTASLPANLALD
jgi:dTDP-3-amino-3,4,6-trideoxy-alpha-D-glucose transaminase